MHSLVQMTKISKTFPGVTALNEIDFELRTGEVHALLGENGAGKSTLMKILSGVYSPTSGSISILGHTYTSLDPKISRQEGIGTIYQELSIIDQLSIGENLFLGNLPGKTILSLVDKKVLSEKAQSVLEQIGLNRSAETLALSLSISEKQIVEIGRSLTRDLKVLVLDEPTSSLTSEETKTLFRIIRDLKKKGVGVVYISHKLDEIKQISDRISVLRDGNLVGTHSASDLTTDQMVSLMVGRNLDRRGRLTSSRQGGFGDIQFQVKDLSRQDGKVKDVSFHLRQGEILGFAGLIGSGRTELLESLFGVVPLASGSLLLNGKELSHKNPHQAMKSRLAFITENRRETGFFGNFTIQENSAMAVRLLNSRLGGLWGLVNKKTDEVLAKTQKEKLKIRCASLTQNISELSGGNQQKVLIGKWLSMEPEVMFFDEPTRGIDVGAKAEIYQILRTLSDSGRGVIVVSSELPELLYLCDRIIVFRQGTIAGEENVQTATEEGILQLAMPL